MRDRTGEVVRRFTGRPCERHRVRREKRRRSARKHHPGNFLVMWRLNWAENRAWNSGPGIGLVDEALGRGHHRDQPLRTSRRGLMEAPRVRFAFDRYRLSIGRAAIRGLARGFGGRERRFGGRVYRRTSRLVTRWLLREFRREFGRRGA